MRKISRFPENQLLQSPGKLPVNASNIIPRLIGPKVKGLTEIRTPSVPQPPLFPGFSQIFLRQSQ